MRLIANRQLTGEYGTVIQGQEFEVRDDVARELLRSGVVRKPDPPRVTYETKVITPEAPEVSARLPFRDVHVSHQESAPVASESNHVLPETDVPQPGAADSGGRRKRSRPDPDR